MSKNRLTKEEQLEELIAQDYGRICSYWPLFKHRQCVRCRDLIRRESIWCVVFNEPGEDNYYCTTCFPTKGDVYQVALSGWVEHHKKCIGGFETEEPKGREVTIHKSQGRAWNEVVNPSEEASEDT